MRIELCRVGTNETLIFAAEELRKYLYLIDDTVEVDIFAYGEYRKDRKGGVWLLESSDLAPTVEDARLDDAFKISINENSGFIAGTNPISVLIGIYSLLKKLGCTWIRPGRDGEIITKQILSPLCFDYEERASYRYRGIDGGGGPVEKLLDMIDWLPKEGMNNYYIEGLHPEETVREAYPELDEKDKKAAFDEFIRQMKKRGIKRHAAGHGWTILALGKPAKGHVKYTLDDFTPQQIESMAMVNGKRGLYWQGGRINATQLCYSKKQLRDKITDYVVDYVKLTDYAEYVHFWLADGVNNHCECEECKKHLPSDWYVIMLNELDEKLTRDGIDTKIVCLVYVDLLWEPKEFKINNPDRFILMFAPITRIYDTSYAINENEIAEKTPYVRNNLTWPTTAKENILYVSDWQKNQLNGDSFVFDYHLMWNQYKDPGYRKLSRIVYEDMLNLKNNNFNGNISCEIIRCQMPHDFPHRIMARTLWNKALDYEREELDFFRESFGENWHYAFDYLTKITDAFSVIYRFYRDSEGTRGDGIALAERVSAVVSEYRPKIEDMIGACTHRAIRLSWELLFEHTYFVIPFAKAYAAKYAKNAELAESYLAEFDNAVDSICDKYDKYVSRSMSKYSVRFYCNEINEKGAEPLIF